MKKVWKALFYAMWHSDGREVQRELATSIAAVMHSLKSQMAILYASVFFWTMRNEWAGIDKHRLDKYCVLARQMQKQRHALGMIPLSVLSVMGKIAMGMCRTVGQI